MVFTDPPSAYPEWAVRLARKQTIQFTHFSKAGGSSMCQLARTNNCTTVTKPPGGRNCSTSPSRTVHGGSRPTLLRMPAGFLPFTAHTYWPAPGFPKRAEPASTCRLTARALAWALTSARAWPIRALGDWSTLRHARTQRAPAGGASARGLSPTSAFCREATRAPCAPSNSSTWSCCASPSLESSRRGRSCVNTDGPTPLGGGLRAPRSVSRSLPWSPITSTCGCSSDGTAGLCRSTASASRTTLRYARATQPSSRERRDFGGHAPSLTASTPQLPRPTVRTTVDHTPSLHHVYGHRRYVGCASSIWCLCWRQWPNARRRCGSRLDGP